MLHCRPPLPSSREGSHDQQLLSPILHSATGPRSWTLLEGQRREALDAILDVADVVLMTQVRPLTGII
jgi:hypothetical protein